jgi:carbon storage regulator
MLILTRKIDQSIIIDGKITVMVLGVERDRVKLGINAPANVTVLREELFEESAPTAPSPLRRKVAKPPITDGSLALKPDNKNP